MPQDLRQQAQQAAQTQAQRDDYAEKMRQFGFNPDGTSGVTQFTPEDHYRWARYAGLLGGGMADAVTTRMALSSNPNVGEGNPMVGDLAGSNIGLAAFKIGSNAAIGSGPRG